jgi:hypothetical protein
MIALPFNGILYQCRKQENFSYSDKTFVIFSRGLLNIGRLAVSENINQNIKAFGSQEWGEQQILHAFFYTAVEKIVFVASVAKPEPRWGRAWRSQKEVQGRAWSREVAC